MQVVDPVYKLSNEFTSADLALAACPQKKNVCGTLNKYTYADSSISEDEITMSSFTDKDSCTYLIKAECGAPGFYIDTTSGTPDNTVIGLHYVEYDYSEDNGVNI